VAEPRTGAKALLAALAALAALALVACGSDEQPSAEVEGVGPVRAGSVAALATCRDWRRGSVPERLATIEDLRNHVEGEEAEGGAPALSDEDTYDLIHAACEPTYASGFKLYKVYARGAVFSGLEP
jgi:hypothetical protein